jgi:glycosyltransferase involved in cell wall biosynthesis
MIDKVDVIICVKDPAQIRPKLLNCLNNADWVNNIILETSKPLALARIRATEKCTTEWIAMFDDDVEIPDDWFDRIIARLRIRQIAGMDLIPEDVVAISTPDMSQIPDYYYMQLLSDRLFKLSKRDTPFIDNCLFRKSALIGYDPPLAFYCEDEFFYEHVKKSGRWLHTDNIGVKHFYREKDAVYSGASQRVYKFESRWNVLRRLLVRTAMGPLVAIFYTHKLSTVKRFWNINYRFIIGWIFYNRYAVGIVEAKEV